MNLLMKIVKGCGNLSDKTVVEVGAGPGNLTRYVVVEKNSKEKKQKKKR